jgi:hypothetical protein
VRRAAFTAQALVALALVALGAGCGGQEFESNPAPPLVTATQVAGQFERETGRPLQRAAEPDEAWDQLSYGLNPSEAELDRYGIFSVYVAKPGHVDALDSLLRDKATRKALERDSRGVYWELDSNSGTWIAYKRYVGNVVLVWFSESKERALDARWERLDGVLAELAR